MDEKTEFGGHEPRKYFGHNELGRTGSHEDLNPNTRSVYGGVGLTNDLMKSTSYLFSKGNFSPVARPATEDEKDNEE